MNLVKSITDLLSSEVISRLSKLLGTDHRKVETAVSAVVPSLLAGLSNLASQEDGVRKATRMLSGLGDEAIGNFDRALQADPDLLQQKGGGFLNGLFGEGMIGSLATSIGRFAGLNSDTVSKLLGYLSPLVLSRVASQWQGQGGTPGALKSLMADQQRHINAALPQGFSLDDVPGWSSAGDVSRAVSRTEKQVRTASPSLMSTLLPLGILLLGAVLLWNFWRNRSEPVAPEGDSVVTERDGQADDRLTTLKPVAPDADAMADVTRMKDNLSGVVGALGETLTSITDAQSAEAAMSELEELNQKIDTLKTTIDKLPRADRVEFQSGLQDQLDPLTRRANETLSLPGLSDRIKALINAMISKLEGLRIVE